MSEYNQLTTNRSGERRMRLCELSSQGAQISASSKTRMPFSSAIAAPLS